MGRMGLASLIRSGGSLLFFVDEKGISTNGYEVDAYRHGVPDDHERDAISNP